jgi:hypothetical protein
VVDAKKVSGKEGLASLFSWLVFNKVLRSSALQNFVLGFTQKKALKNPASFYVKLLYIHLNYTFVS